jgi:uncharacterized membrane protein YeaQ/YmgE (transglycosylase-associated protein family)
VRSAARQPLTSNHYEILLLRHQTQDTPAALNMEATIERQAQLSFPWYADEQKHSLEASTVYPRQAFTRTLFMNFILWLVVGGLIGWAASALMRTREGIALNVVVGIVGAALAGWLLSPLFGVSTINQSNFSAASLLVSLLGAVLLLVIVNWVRRAALR